MNKAHSSSSAEYIRNQQNFPHDTAIILYSALPGDIYIASTFHRGLERGIRQIPTVILQMEAQSSWGFLLQRHRKHLMLLAGPLPFTPGKADRVGPGVPQVL